MIPNKQSNAGSDLMIKVLALKRNTSQLIYLDKWHKWLDALTF